MKVYWLQVPIVTGNHEIRKFTYRDRLQLIDLVGTDFANDVFGSLALLLSNISSLTLREAEQLSMNDMNAWVEIVTKMLNPPKKNPFSIVEDDQ